MTPSQPKHLALHQALLERRLLKVIAGLTNVDRGSVLAIARAAQAGGAQAVDIAADASLIAAVKAETDLVVFVSSTEPSQLIAAAAAGADVLEIGNYDALYHQGIHPTSEQILEWAREVKQAVGQRISLCVTVSGHLPLPAQMALAVALQDLGVDLLQTEGQVGPVADEPFAALSSAVQALGNTAAIRGVVDLPLLLAGGFNRISAPFAIAAGADALGVGKCVSALGSHDAMTAEVKAIAAALEAVHATGKGLAHV